MRDIRPAESKTYVKKRFFRYKDGADHYSLCKKSFIKLANDADAIRPWRGVMFVDADVVDEYLENQRP